MIRKEQRDPLENKHTQQQHYSDLINPTFLMILIPSIIFMSEVIVMILLTLFSPMSIVNEALLDASMLILFLFPLLYYLTIKPVRLYMDRNQRYEKEQKELIGKLQDAHNEVKALQRMLPICGKCKEIRNDREYLNQVENYIQEHPKIELTGALCSKCYKGSGL